MDDSSVMKLALIMGLAGIFLLLVIASVVELPISEYESLRPGEVRIRGYLESSYTSGHTTFLRIAEQRHITVIAFQNLSLANGSYLEVTGTYKNEEIIAEKIISSS